MIQLLFLIPLFAISHGASLKLEPRIIGGKLARRGEIPYQVSLQNRNDQHFCGGVIINKRFVLTVAHCVYGANISDFSINAGSTDLRKPHSKHLVQSIYTHEKYKPVTYHYDIAIVKLQKSLSFSSLISSVDLPEQNQKVKAGSLAVVSGFGAISADGNTKSTLLYVVGIIITNQTYCRETYAKVANVTIYHTQICANYPTIQKGACVGDSGGPLTVNRQLVGLVSFGYGPCTTTKYPTVFTRVPSYIDWIHEHTRDAGGPLIVNEQLVGLVFSWLH